MRVRTGRFMQSLIRIRTSFGQDAHKAGGMSQRRSRLNRSGLIVK
jgi:hypothetical protein